MEHGNKKYNLEQLQKAGDTIIVKPANIYSLKNQMRKFFGSHNFTKKFSFEGLPDGFVLVTKLDYATTLSA